MSRRRWIVLIVLLGLLGFRREVVRADVGACPGLSSPLAPIGFEQITVSTVSIGFTGSKVTNAIMAVVTVETNGVRFRDDGTAPTSSVGQPVAANGTIQICGNTTIGALRFIRSGSADATVDASYYGPSAK